MIFSIEHFYFKFIYRFLEGEIQNAREFVFNEEEKIQSNLLKKNLSKERKCV